MMERVHERTIQQKRPLVKPSTAALAAQQFVLISTP